MAEVLELLGCFALGIAIGWRFRRRAELRELARATTDLLAAQWADHVDAHAKSLEGSVAITAAPLLDASKVGKIRAI